MKINAFWKGFIMAIVGFVATTLSDLETFNLAYVLIATVGFTVIYVGKNAIFKSTSGAGTINLQDLLSGVIVAVGMAISSFAASVITSGAVDWKELGVAVIGAVVGYFTKTVPQKGK